MIPNLSLNANQVNKLLSNEDLSGLVDDQASGENPCDMTDDGRRNLAAIVLINAARAVKTFDRGEDVELQILEWDGIFVVYSSSMEWCGPFDTEWEALGFVKRMGI